MEKLERILDVEERAAGLIAEARERAVTIERDAAAEAARVRRQTLTDARASVEAATAELLAKTRGEADALGAQAAMERERAIESASGRIPEAVAAVLSELAD